MNFYWIYDLPMIGSFTLVVGSITFYSIEGIFIMKPYVSKWWSGHDNNDQIAFYLSAVGVFYGITLGLFAAGVWQNLEDSEEKVTTEASAIAALYRDVRSFPAPKNVPLKKLLIEYTDYVIHNAFALHKKGVAVTKGTSLLDQFQDELYSFEPKTQREIALFQEALRQYNRVVELRRQRLSSVNNGMPLIVWILILLGGAITLSICWLFNIPSLRMHIIMNGLIGLAVGTLIYLIIMLDYPFRGELSINTQAYEQVYTQLMK